MTKERKVILITGSSSGIGYQLAKLLSEDTEDGECILYATSRRINPELEQLAGEFVRVKKLDVTQDEDSEKVIDEIIQKEGRIDVVVHCAGINHFQPIEKVTVDEARQVIDTNVIGLVHLTSKCLDHMKEKMSGHIIAVSAFSGILGVPFNSIYSASKFALEGYFESLRAELSDFNIRVNIVEVGPVTTSHDMKALEKLEVVESEGEEQGNLIETFKQKVDASYQTMGQPPEDISLYIRTIIDSPDKGQFRYVTNEIYANALSWVFKEKTKVKSRLSSTASTL